LVSARVVQARGNKVPHAELAHVAERHWFAGWLFGLHSITWSARASNEGGTSKPGAETAGTDMTTYRKLASREDPFGVRARRAQTQLATSEAAR
jgi:hypothetical protein